MLNRKVSLVVTALLATAPMLRAESPTTRPAGGVSPTKLLLRVVPEISLVKVPLSRVLRRYTALSGLTVQADWGALKDVGITKDTPVTLKARRLTFEKLLDLTLNSIAPPRHPLAWFLTGRKVLVSTQMRVLLRGRPVLRPARVTRSVGRVRRTRARTGFRPPKEINFEQISLKDALDFLRDVAGVNFHVNWRSLETAGISRDTPITVKAKGISIGRALDLVLDQLNAGRDRFSSIYWVIDGGVVRIATGEALNRTTKVRVIDISDLLMVVPNFKGPEINLGGFGNNASNNGSSFSSGSTGGTSIFDTGNTSGTDTSSGTSDTDEDNISEQRQKKRDTIVRIIMDAIGEDMWQPTGKGSIHILNNKLVISQTPLGFKLLEEALSR